jgi:hypothetical protein
MNLRVAVTSLALAACADRPENVENILRSAMDLPCLRDDAVTPVAVDDASALGFSGLDLIGAVGAELSPELRRRPPYSGYPEHFDPTTGFVGGARLTAIQFDPDSFEIVDRSGAAAELGYRSTGYAGVGGPSGGPRPDYTCHAGRLLRGWATATVVFAHEDEGELSWEIQGFFESPSAERDEVVLLLADWQRDFSDLPRPWRRALEDEVLSREDPFQAQAVVEGQIGWGGWMSVYLALEGRGRFRSFSASPVVDYRWINPSYAR